MQVNARFNTNDAKLTDSISAYPVQHAALGDGFERRASKDAVHSLLQEVAEAQLRRHVMRQLPELAVVGIRHARETHAKPEEKREAF